MNIESPVHRGGGFFYPSPQMVVNKQVLRYGEEFVSQRTVPVIHSFLVQRVKEGVAVFTIRICWQAQ